jgi:hypothetical protein
MMRFDKPYSVLVSGGGSPDDISKYGPFLSYEEAMEHIRQFNDEDFDFDNQHIYIMTPDHRLIEIYSDDLDAPPVAE